MARFLSLLFFMSSPYIYSQQHMQVSRCYKVNWDGPIQNIFIDADQNKWVGTDQTLYQVLACDLINTQELPSGQKSLLQIRDGNHDVVFSMAALSKAAGEMIGSSETVRTAHFDTKRNELWVGTTYSGVLVYHVEQGLRLSAALTRKNSKLISDQINVIHLDTEDRLWIGTDAGLLVRSEGRWDLLEKDFRFHAIAEDSTKVGALSEDFILLASPGKVLTRKELDPASIRGHIRDIEFDREGYLWLASNVVTRYNLENDQFTIYDGPAYFTSELATCLAIDDQNVVWVGTDDKGLYAIEKESNLVAMVELTRGLSCDQPSVRASLQVKVSGGEPPYQYEWQSGISGPSPANVGPGTHTVYITDSKGKSARAQVNIPDPSLSISVEPRDDLLVDSVEAGAAEITIERGVSPYTYRWDNGETGKIAHNLTFGMHSVTVTAGNGCTDVDSVLVSGPAKGMAVFLTEKLRNHCAGQNGNSLKVLIDNGQEPFTYSWNRTGITGGEPTNLPAGNYHVTVTDALGSQASASISLADPPEIRIDLELIAPSDVSLANGQVLARVSGGRGNYSFLWDNGEQLSMAKNLDPGTHVLTVTDANGCEATASIDIPGYVSSLSISFSQSAVNLCYGDKRAAILVDVQGGKGPYEYEWNDPSLTGTQLKGLAAGNYTVTVRDQAGQTASSSLFVREPPPISISTKVIAAASTGGEEDGVARVEASGGNGSFTYLWDNGETGMEATNLSSGDHTVTVTDIQDCSATALVEIPEEVLSLALDLKQVGQITCSGGNQGALEVEVVGGKAPFSYTWNRAGLSGSHVLGLQAGEYRVTVTDESGQNKTAAITINEPGPLSAKATQQSPSEIGQGNGQASVSIGGGTGTYSIEWDNGERGPTASRLTPGLHEITVTDDNDCQVTTAVEITENVRALSVDLVQTRQNLCTNDTLAALQVQISGGKGPFEYRWNRTNINGSQVSGLPAGNYQVTVTDAAGQVANKSISIRGPDPVRVSVSADEPASVGLADGKASAKVSGGTGNYSFKWDNGETGGQATVLVSGQHSLTVVDGNQCIDSATVEIPERITTLGINVSLVRGNPCSGESLASVQVHVEGGKGPYQYRWSRQNLSGERVTGLPAGNYQVTVADASGQSRSAGIRITDPPPIKVTTALESIEGVQKATVRATGGTGNYVYRWDNGETKAVADSLGSGLHSVTVRDVNGCSVSGQIVMPDELFPLAFQLVQEQGNPCAGDQKASIRVQSSGGKKPFEIKWSGSGSSEEVRGGLAAGLYEATVTDANGATSVASIRIEDPKPLRIRAVVRQNASMGNADGQATAMADGGTGNHKFSWDNGENFPLLSNLSPGIHSVTVQDENGCTATTEIEITEDILPMEVNLQQRAQNTCAGDRNASVQVEVSGGKAPFQFNWSEPSLTGDYPSNLSGGTYTVTVVDASGASYHESITIADPEPLNVRVQPTQAASTGNADGQATATVTGGAGNYLYEWDNGETTPSATNLSPGNHTVNVSDENGCEITAEVQITEDILPLAVNLIQTAEIICAGDQTAGVNAQISGGKGPYRYEWNKPGLSGDQIAGLAPGNYSLTVSDLAGHEMTAEIDITDPVPLSVQIQGVQPAGTNRSDGRATALASGGTGDYLYIWDNEENESTALKLAPGKHTVTVTDQNGCSETATIEIVEDILPLQASLVQTENNLCAGDTRAALQVHPSGGKQPFQYQWNHAEITGPQVVQIGAGHYSVSVTDAVGSVAVSEITIYDPEPLSITINSVGPASANQTDGHASLSCSGGTGQYLYDWDNGESVSAVYNLSPGAHTVTVTDANGCTETATVQISENILPLEVSLIQAAENRCAGDQEAVVQAQLAGGKGPFQYQWSDSTSTNPRLSGLASGTYSLTVTDASNQMDSASITISAPPKLEVAIVEPRAATDESSADGKAQAVVNGGTPPYSISWDNGETGPEATQLGTGVHRITATDDPGCIAYAEFEIHKKILPQLSVSRLRTGQLIRMEQLFFEADSAELEEASIPVLEELYGFMKDNSSVVVRVEGHTNDVPPHEFCDWLSTERSKAVAEYIVGKGIASERVYYRGYGKRQPAYNNLTPEGRRLNQRVEINILQIGNSN